MNKKEAKSIKDIKQNETNPQIQTKSDEKEYALYTEKIVESPQKKYRKLINGVKATGMFCVFLTIISVLMFVVIPWYESVVAEKNTDQDELTIEKDEYRADDDLMYLEIDASLEGTDSMILQTRGEEDENSSIENYDAAVEELNSKLEIIQKSVVSIGQKRDEANLPIPEDEDESLTSGLIVGYVNSQYIIVAQSSSISSSTNMVVKFSTGEEVNAHLKARNTYTDMIVLAVNAVDMSYTMLQSVNVAVLDNSYNVHQGDAFLSYGKIGGRNQTVDYGMISELYMDVNIDSTYEIFRTNLAYESGDYSFLFNTAGNVIGISYGAKDNQMQAIGISDLKAIIESMSNKGGIAHFGIYGKNVTPSMTGVYDVPVGLFISEVEIDSPAYDAGLQSGDVICEVNGNSVLTIQLFSEKLYRCSSGQSMMVRAKRKGKDGYYDVSFQVILGMR